MDDYNKAAKWIEESNKAAAFTGAGISVESGIPTFRGPTGLWSRYDPKILDLGYFYQHPRQSWEVIKEIFYEHMGAKARPNAAHRFLAKLERLGKLKGVITQNIDNLHQEAGSKNVIEFHGTASRLLCTNCAHKTPFSEDKLGSLPPYCDRCGGVLKPDFIFFGESIPPKAYKDSIELVKNADLLIIIGTSGEVMPASMIPYEAKNAKVIEINIEASAYSSWRSDIFLKAKAGQAAKELAKRLGIEL